MSIKYAVTEERLIKKMVDGFLGNLEALGPSSLRDAVGILHNLGRQEKSWGEAFAEQMEHPPFQKKAQRALLAALKKKGIPF